MIDVYLASDIVSRSADAPRDWNFYHKSMLYRNVRIPIEKSPLYVRIEISAWRDRTKAHLVVPDSYESRNGSASEQNASLLQTCFLTGIVDAKRQTWLSTCSGSVLMSAISNFTNAPGGLCDAQTWRKRFIIKPNTRVTQRELEKTHARVY